MYHIFSRSAAAIVLAIVTELEETVVMSMIFLFGIIFCRYSFLAILYDQKPARPHSRLPCPMFYPRGEKSPCRPAGGGPPKVGQTCGSGMGPFLPGDNTQCDVFLCLCVTWGK